MNYESYLLFTLDGSSYGLPASAVQEIFFLPALTAVAESGAEVAGVLNLRGGIIPVLDLNTCLGKPQKTFLLSHAVVVLRLENQVIGLIVSEVHDVEAVPTEDITSDLDNRLISRSERHLVAGLAKFKDDIITLLNPLALPLQQAHRAISQASPQPVAAGAEVPSHQDFLAQFTPEQQQVLRDRAASLAQAFTDDGFAGLAALAVVSLEGERFALGLESVHEFTDVTQITPIPCCPGHIVGNMNLRGEILTLVDIRGFLNLDATPDRQSKKAVVMRLDQLVAGVVVDEVFDVVYVHPKEISSIPTAIHSADNEYLKGVAKHEDSMMSLLDLPRLLTQGELVVNQTG
jgi:purine-binding chemotaxis protein CheW